MIFSRIFSPTYTSSNPEKRIQAIARLTPEKAHDRAKLHELAFNDGHSEVSLAALEKLDSFPLWLKMSQTASDESVRRRALRRVEAVIADPASNAISAAEKSEYLLKQAPVDLVRKVLSSQQTVASDDEVTMALLAKVGRDDFVLQYFSRYASAAVQERIANNTTDLATLHKLLKKSDQPTVSQSIEARIALLTQAAEKPKQLEQAYTLTLSKLQALSERHDFNDVDERLQSCMAELDVMTPELSLLADETAGALNEKRERLVERALRHHQQLKAVWRAESSAREAEDLFQSLRHQVAEAGEKVQWLYTERLSEATLEDVETVNAQVRNIEEQVNKFNLKPEDRDYLQLCDAVAKLTEQLDTFSAQQQIAQRLMAVLDKAELLIANADGPLEQDVWSAFRQQWAESAELLYPLPAAWKARWSVLARNQKQQETALRADAEQALKQCRRVLSLISNLVESGRFRGAMAREKDLDTAYQLLDQQRQEQLSRRYNQVKEQLSRLEGWQSYLAAPRKPALVEQAQLLATSEADDISSRAEAIKVLRQQWLSLSVGQSKDHMDEAFDAALEAAFVPCREFYAKQEQLREEAAQAREALLNELLSLPSENTDIAALSRQLEKLKQRWRDSGTVEKEKYISLKKRWDAALAPLNKVVTSWFAENRARKQAVIDEARSLAESDDLAQSASRAQALQQHWKTIGHAGKRYESKLWQAFKEVNDALFSEVKNQRQTEQKQQSEQIERLFEQIRSISRTVSLQPEATDAALVPVIEAMQSLDSRKQTLVQQRIDKLRRNAQNQLQESALDDRRGSIQALSALVRDWNGNGGAINIEALPKVWRQAAQQGGDTADKSRSWYTHVLEIMLGIAPISAQTSERRDVQLALMTARLERGDEDSFVDTVACWLSFGQPDDEERRRILHILDKVQGNAELLRGVG